MADLVGKTLGNYRIVEPVGRGGMAAVYKAYQPALERYVAVKVIHEQLAASDEQFLRRFRREAKAVAALRHPNIVQVFDFGIEGNASYMVMEYLDGITLKAELNALAERDEIMSLEEAWRVFNDVAGAVAYAHGQGMVHRDIKPANVILTNKGDVILSDFGIARIAGATQYTATGAVIGTPAYLSPEQGKGERGDERSDIYALGVVLYEMVTGRVPFDADTPLAVIYKHISDPLPLPRQLNPSIPEAVEQVILKALAKQADDRYQTADEMIAKLKDAVADDGEGLEDVAPVESSSVEASTVLHDARSESAVPAAARTGFPAGAPAAPRRQGVRFSQAAWRRIAAVMVLLAISWGACGLLFGSVPNEPTEANPNPESTNFWITRGCFLGPAFSLAFMAYMSVVAGRRRGRDVRCSELAAALGVALGLIPVLLGLAIIVQPAPDEGDRVFAPLLCLLPGLFIIGLSSVFWALVARRRQDFGT